ncbi:NAD(P)H-dependent oxidoreductase [Oligoflexaceae bacterium]|nr:NAD(P)H-dependent oxidoreductase [Oligoflexaceae bacterium]
MKTAIIIGSHRENSQSTKVGGYIASKLKSMGHQTYIFDLQGNPLPLWDESIWQSDPTWSKRWSPISKELESCDSAVIVSPEWGGMVPAALKNFFLLVGKELAHKPAMIAAVSASKGGSYPIAELRMSSYKNTFINYIPDHVIVRDVENVLEGETAKSDDDSFIRSRIEYSLKILTHYAAGLKKVRDSGDIDFKTYPFGM